MIKVLAPVDKNAVTIGPASRLKPQYGWSVVALLPVTPRVGDQLIRWGFSANAVSWGSFIAFLLGLVVYLFGGASLVALTTTAVLFTTGTLLDVVDGYVARATKTTGRYGAVLDAALDLARYNLFFLAVAVARRPSKIGICILCYYAVLITISLIRNVQRAYRGKSGEKVANLELERRLPAGYTDWCLRHRLLYNPFNLEDQLNLGLFFVAVLTQGEIAAMAICGALRTIEIAVGMGRLVKRGT